MPMWTRVAFTAGEGASRESTSVPSRSKMRRSISESEASGRFAFSGAGASGAGGGLAPRAAVFELVLPHFGVEGVAMNAELLAGGALVAPGLLERALDHAPLQEFDGLRQEDVAFEEMIDQAV